MKTNVLYFGDNLETLRNRKYFPDECIDLIYLNPAFNSKKDYNILFKDNGGVESEAQRISKKERKQLEMEGSRDSI